jgi:predicted  nucleic acid-binding Zn-ribbon protein
MSELSILIELQAVHDNLRVIQRDLANFPPDLAALDAELKTLARRAEETAKSLAATRAQQASLSTELGLAQRLEDHARVGLKGATQKVQYTAAIRELDERQRQKDAVARPLKEAEGRIASLAAQEKEIAEKQAETQKQFDELKAIFDSEHGNQVEARTVLEARQAELEATLPASVVTRFGRLLQQRQGRAVVAVEGGACGGCHTRLRTPFLAQLRDTGPLACESCQRFLYDPSRA